MNNQCLKLGAALLAALVTTDISFSQSPATAPGSAMKPAQGPLVATLRTQWETTRNLMLGICEIVPESKYDYRATADVRSFRELFIHVAQEGYNFMAPVGGVTPPNMKAIEELKTRDE